MPGTKKGTSVGRTSAGRIRTVGYFELPFHFAQRREEIELDASLGTETVLELSISLAQLSEVLKQNFRIRLRFAILQSLK